MFIWEKLWFDNFFGDLLTFTIPVVSLCSDTCKLRDQSRMIFSHSLLDVEVSNNFDTHDEKIVKFGV